MGKISRSGNDAIAPTVSFILSPSIQRHQKWSEEFSENSENWPKALLKFGSKRQPLRQEHFSVALPPKVYPMIASVQMRQVIRNVTQCPGTTSPTGEYAPCAGVVGAQSKGTGAMYQVPEPWRGNIAEARLLFVSSNPGYGVDDDSPTRRDGAQNISDYYQNKGFPSCFPKNLMADGEPAQRAVKFWSEIRARAGEMYDVPKEQIQAGVDFALTEVVHCKSTSEGIARTAAPICVAKHFGSVVRLSRAPVVVVLGALTADALGLPHVPQVLSMDFYGRKRLVAWLPHPNARGPRKCASLYDPSQLAQLRSALKA